MVEGAPLTVPEGLEKP